MDLGDEKLLLDGCMNKLDSMVAILAAMSDEDANTVPDFPGANSPVQIVAHCLGAVRWWSSTQNLGVTIPRDRAAEFRTVAPVADILAATARTRADFLTDAEAMGDPAQAPAHLPPGEDRPWSESRGGVILHIFEELAQHLGHLEITRDLLAAR